MSKRRSRHKRWSGSMAASQEHADAMRGHHPTLRPATAAPRFDRQFRMPPWAGINSRGELNFGKYAGFHLDEADEVTTGYLLWLVDQEIPDALFSALAAELDRRAGKAGIFPGWGQSMTDAFAKTLNE